MCNKSWQVPGERFVIPKGTQVYIPIVGFNTMRFITANHSNQIGLHCDHYFPDPEKSDC